jgi:hypothetical protein
MPGTTRAVLLPLQQVKEAASKLYVKDMTAQKKIETDRGSAQHWK